MFDQISGKYDFLNHFLSFGIDRIWRKRLVREMKKINPSDVLDLATGTADLAISLASAHSCRITGADISEGMMEVGREKIGQAGLADRISLVYGEAENLGFLDESFDAVMIAFGVRNFEDLSGGLKEMRRVTRRNGKVFILEFSHPSDFPLKQFYGIYSRFVIPMLGRLVSSHPSAYKYLPETVAAFPSGKAFEQIMSEAGFSNCRTIRLSGGIASLYIGENR